MQERDRLLLLDAIEHGDLALGLAKGMPLARFEADVGVRYGCERLLEIVGEAVGNLSDAAKDGLGIDARKVRGLRNFLAHRYRDVDAALVHRAVLVELPKLLVAARAALDSAG